MFGQNNQLDYNLNDMYLTKNYIKVIIIFFKSHFEAFDINKKVLFVSTKSVRLYQKKHKY